MGLGLTMCDRFTLPWDKVAIDLSFEGTWRSWQHRHRLSQVDTDIRPGLDDVWAMNRADRRKTHLQLLLLGHQGVTDLRLPASD